MDDRVTWVSGHGITLLAILAALTFASGYWGILIALAPAVYLLVFIPHDADNAPKIVVIGHSIALIYGWMAYTGFAQGITPMSIEPMSEPGLRIVGSTIVAFVVSIAVFYALHIHHPMAYVTAFTAAIGAFPTLQAVAVIIGTILIVAGLQAARRKLGPPPETGSETHTEQYVQL